MCDYVNILWYWWISNINVMVKVAVIATTAWATTSVNLYRTCCKNTVAYWISKAKLSSREVSLEAILR